MSEELKGIEEEELAVAEATVVVEAKVAVEEEEKQSPFVGEVGGRGREERREETRGGGGGRAELAVVFPADLGCGALVPMLLLRDDLMGVTALSSELEDKDEALALVGVVTSKRMAPTSRRRLLTSSLVKRAEGRLGVLKPVCCTASGGPMSVSTQEPRRRFIFASCLRAISSAASLLF